MAESKSDEYANEINDLSDADALIWDLRDGWGGAQPEYLDLFDARAPTMQVTSMDGPVSFRSN